MSKYINLTLTDSQFSQLIDDLMTYASNLDNYYEIEDAVHLIDFLYDEYHASIREENKKINEQFFLGDEN